MIAQQSLECGDPAPLWIWYGVTKAGLTRRHREGETGEMRRTMKDMKIKSLNQLKLP